MDIDLEELAALNNPLLVDVRSPAEYDEDHLPGSVNLPVLTNKQRERVGTLYNQQSTFEARRIGAGLICENVPQILETLERHHTGGQPVVVYCWRGGLRSRSLAVILDHIGYPTHRLEGGYKQYRRHVHRFLTESRWESPLIGLYGLTGSGKTRLLAELEARGASVLDLEAAAGHRGSAFGNLGLGPQPSQKAFENRIYQQIHGARPPLFTEGESRMIGGRKIPDSLFEALTAPPRIRVETDRDRRVQNIARHYAREDALRELNGDLGNLKERLGGDTVYHLRRNLEAGRFERVIRRLLVDYYDPAYRRSMPDPDEADLTVRGTDLSRAAKRILQHDWDRFRASV